MLDENTVQVLPQIQRVQCPKCYGHGYRTILGDEGWSQERCTNCDGMGEVGVKA